MSNYNYSGKVFIQTEKTLPRHLNSIKIQSVKGFTDKKLYNIFDIPITEDITSIKTYLLDIKDLLPFSLTNIEQKNICTERNLNYGENFIENKYIKIEIVNKSFIVTDKKTNEKYNDFITITDRADIGDSYNFGALKNDRFINGEVIDYKIKEKNHIRLILNVLYEIKIPVNSNDKGRSKKTSNCNLNIDFILYNQSEMCEIEVKWVNKSKNHLLQVGFNLKEKIVSTKSEDLYSLTTREFDPDYNIYSQIPAPKGLEIKTNTAPMQRFVNVQNLLLVTLGINEYEVNKNILYLTLLRATGAISNPYNTCRGTSAGPPIQTPKLQCLGDNISNFAFAFTTNEEKMYKLCEEFYKPCICLFTNKKNKIFFEHPYRVQAITFSEGKLCVRNNKLDNQFI